MLQAEKPRIFECLELSLKSKFDGFALCLQMWREEIGFLETFLAYYSQFDENLTQKKTYRDFLCDIISAHEQSLV